MIFRRFFRWTHWRARAKFWRHRAIKAEAQLEAERWRNLEREDTLMTVPMRSLGMFGIAPRSGPAPIRQPARPAALLTSADPWDTLTYADRMEFETMWLPDAQRAGVPLREAQQKFLQELASRRTPFNDEFSS